MTSSVLDVLHDFSPQVTHNLVFLLAKKTTKTNPHPKTKTSETKRENICYVFSLFVLSLLYYKIRNTVF